MGQWASRAKVVSHGVFHCGGGRPIWATPPPEVKRDAVCAKVVMVIRVAHQKCFLAAAERQAKNSDGSATCER